MTVIFVLIALVSLLVGVAYQLLPYRFGLPLLALLMGSWFVWARAATQEGAAPAAVDQLMLGLIVGLAAWFAALPVLWFLRPGHRAPQVGTSRGSRRSPAS